MCQGLVLNLLCVFTFVVVTALGILTSGYAIAAIEYYARHHDPDDDDGTFDSVLEDDEFRDFWDWRHWVYGIAFMAAFWLFIAAIAVILSILFNSTTYIFLWCFYQACPCADRDGPKPRHTHVTNIYHYGKEMQTMGRGEGGGYESTLDTELL